MNLEDLTVSTGSFKFVHLSPEEQEEINQLPWDSEEMADFAEQLTIDGRGMTLGWAGAIARQALSTRNEEEYVAALQYLAQLLDPSEED